MERRQPPPPANETWDRPGYGGSSVQQTPRLRPEAPQFPPPPIAPRHGEAPPGALFPGSGPQRSGPWESRPPHDGSEQRTHRGGRVDYTQDGYYEPPHGGPQGMPQFRPPPPEVLPRGGTRPRMPPPGPVEPVRILEMGAQPGMPPPGPVEPVRILEMGAQPGMPPPGPVERIQEMGAQPRPPLMQQGGLQAPIIPIHHGDPMQMPPAMPHQEKVSDHRRGSQDGGKLHGTIYHPNVQPHNIYHPERHPNVPPVYQPGERHPNVQHHDTVYQPGERHPNVQHHDTVYQPRERHPNVQHAYNVHQLGERHPNVQHHDIVYQPGERHPNVQRPDTRSHPGQLHPNVQHHDTTYQPGERHPNVQRHGGPQSDEHQDALYSDRPRPRSDHPDTYQPHVFPQDGPSSFRGPDPAFALYGGKQPDGFQPNLPHNNLRLPYKNDLNNPLVPDAFGYSAPSQGIQQFSTQLQPVPTQNSPYTDNPNQGHQPLPPMHGHFPNPSFALQPQVGLAFSGTHEESNLEVPQLQRPRNHPPYPLEQQDRSHGPDLLAPSGIAGDSYFKCEAPFPQHDIPVGLRDPHLLPQHGGPFVPQPAPQREDSFLHSDRQTDIENEELSDKDFFMQWLSGFLSCRRKKPLTKPAVVQPHSVAEARGLIYGALQLVSQLDALCQKLESSNKAGEPWTHYYEKADDIRLDLEKGLKELEKPGYIQGVKEKLDRVRKKRLRCQRQRQAAEGEAKAAAERSAEKEARIDLWRMQCVREVEEKKRERELKATADGVLGEVRKKKNDVKKMLDVLKALEKLRKLRKEAAGRKGVCPPPSADETFANHIKRLRTMVHKRSALYDAEEKTLRVILEGEQEEERQRENDKRLRKEKEKVLQKQRELDSILFGDTEPLPSLHPLLPFRQYYLQAEHSVVSLVKIRHEWDQFLVPPDHPDGSSIPRGWVVPTTPSNDIWAIALKPWD